MIKREFGDFVTMIKNSKKGLTDAFFMAQGCNCYITQGSGLAGQLRQFPEIYMADDNYGNIGDRNKLGHFSTARIKFDDRVVRKGKTSAAICFNIYSQYDTGSNERKVNYSAIGIAFRTLNDSLISNNEGRPVLYTHEIGCGLAGGDLDIITMIINDATPDIDVVMLDWAEGVDPRV